MWQNVIDNILHTGITAAERSSKDHNPAWPRSMIKWPGEPFLRVVVTYIAKQQQKKLKRIASTSQSLLELIPNLGERLKGRAVVSISHKLPFYKSFLVARGVKGLEGYLQIFKRLLKGRKLQHASGIIPIQTKI